MRLLFSVFDCLTDRGLSTESKRRKFKTQERGWKVLQSVQLNSWPCCAPKPSCNDIHSIRSYNHTIIILLSTSPAESSWLQLAVEQVYSKTSAAPPSQHKSPVPHTRPPTCSTYTRPSSASESPCKHKNCSKTGP